MGTALYEMVRVIKSYFNSLPSPTDHDLEDLDMQTVRYKPEGLDTLCRATKFNRKELQLMYRGFKQVSHSFNVSLLLIEGGGVLTVSKDI